ncbi:hypothetical protein ACFO5K_10025 [Nocardia halotolerans]|uniref:Uncharacterized protein n=1 Tax=Nocardia halotolerans TaxID=1755878 RepID=A0ABV8VGM0_9NOCA
MPSHLHEGLLAECTDLDQLDAWLTQAVTATSTDELFGWQRGFIDRRGCWL